MLTLAGAALLALAVFETPSDSSFEAGLSQRAMAAMLAATEDDMVNKMCLTRPDLTEQCF